VTLEILHADNHLLVVRKPACVPMVPDESGDESLLEQAKAWVKREYGKPGAVFLGVVHRLDRPVSGVVAFARTSKAAARLTDAFRERRVEKVYWGVVSRAPAHERGELEQWLLKDPEKNRVRVVLPESEGAKRARTRWRVLDTAGSGRDYRVRLELVPETGRSHQLRVAAQSLGAPLLGDLKYGAALPLADKSIALHAAELGLPHPIGGELLRFRSPPPDLEVWRFTGP
jgi:23S rRNA pseudouridine1911/1915/1917 synthase